MDQSRVTGEESRVQMYRYRYFPLLLFTYVGVMVSKIVRGGGKSSEKYISYVLMSCCFVCCLSKRERECVCVCEDIYDTWDSSHILISKKKQKKNKRGVVGTTWGFLYKYVCGFVSYVGLVGYKIHLPAYFRYLCKV